jgi:hypothetical protein
MSRFMRGSFARGDVIVLSKGGFEELMTMTSAKCVAREGRSLASVNFDSIFADSSETHQ